MDRKKPLSPAERYDRAGIGREYQHAEGDFSEELRGGALTVKTGGPDRRLKPGG